MIRLSLLGSLDLRAGDGRQILSVLAQPKRVALLAYLAANRDFVRRDTLLGLFWHESDEEHARHALRQSLYTLRRSLGPRALTSRGDEELGIDCDHLQCDVAVFESAVRDKQAEAALELYKGNFLEGFFLSDAPEFEKWLDGRRTTLRNQAAEAAWTMAQRTEDAGERTEAAAWARRAADYSPDDESSVQRLVGLLDRVGDRAAALRAYEAFAWRLENELGLQPSPETQTVISKIRARQEAAPRSSEGKASEAPAEASRAPAAQTDGEWSLPDESLLEGAPTVTAGFEQAAAEVSAEAETPDGESKKSRFRLGVALAALAAAAVIVDFAEIVQWTASRFYGDGSGSGAVEAPMEVSEADLDPRRIAVLYFDDLSEGGGFDYYAAGLTEWLIQALSEVDGLKVISRNGVKPYRNADVGVDSIVRALQAGTLVEGSITATGDRVRVNVQLIDAATNTHIDSRTVDRPRADHIALLDDLTEEVSLFLRERLGEDIRIREARAGTESSEAWERVQLAAASVDFAKNLSFTGNPEDAAAAYERADRLFAEAESLDPKWIEPIVRRGWVAFEVSRLGKPRPTSPELDRCLAHAERALGQAPGDPRAAELRGTAHLYVGWQEADAEGAANHYELAKADLEAAVAGDPMLARAWAELSHVYVRTGRYEDARWAAERALETDAFLEQKKTVISRMGLAALNAEKPEQALGWARQGLSLYPEEPVFAGLQLLVLATDGETPPPVEEAWELVGILERKLGSDPNDPPERWMMMAAVLARAGLPDSARSVIQRARAAGSEKPYFPYYEATARLALGDRDTTIIRLAEYLAARPTEKANVANDWLWRPLSDDPRFQAIVAEKE